MIKIMEQEKHFYQLEDGTYKRFFDKEDIKKFFEDFEIVYLEEKNMERYEKLKITWIGVIRMNKDNDILSYESWALDGK